MEPTATPAYTQADLEVLVEQERALTFDRPFLSADALAVGTACVRLAPEYERGFGVSVVREADGLVQFQWIADDASSRHLTFMSGKRLAAVNSNHSSLYPFVRHAIDGAYDQWFSEFTPEEPSGGAFPVRVGDEWVATISVSGLHGLDHEVVVRALCEVLGKQYGADVPAFTHDES